MRKIFYLLFLQSILMVMASPNHVACFMMDQLFMDTTN
ncbi:hypothetical protein V6Z11_A05G013100 [Gossypium hirsutum]